MMRGIAMIWGLMLSSDHGNLDDRIDLRRNRCGGD
ncbi:hypothetical protein K227x_44840 [Rubripirellula lacrimiformis]|uniref:Uncharacterized protein n=1 Tax=Rubripirellula lacrimiformis TaxID=1930273 RepID=A0A517NG09_9BACT|nr:hypothetical protein K227x_44840 [Rubripirellula lacrimiformis]